MKKIIIIIIIVAGAVLVYAMRDNFPTETTKAPTTNETRAFRPDPSSATFIFDNEKITLSAGKNERLISSSATFIFDNEKITLSAGKNERLIVPGSVLVEEIVLMDKFAYGDLNADGKEDTVLLLARYGAGSGIFVYLAAFASGPVTYKGSKAIFIGDRIAPQSLFIKGSAVTVEYLDRK